MRLRSRQVSWRIGSIPSRSRIAAAATELICARAPAPSVTLIASASPFNGAALVIMSTASQDTGGAISAVVTNWSVESLSLRVGIEPLFSNFCPDSSVGSPAHTQPVQPAPLGAPHPRP